MRKKPIPFTELDIQFIKDNYLTLNVKQLARHFDCGGCKIQRFLKKNDLIIPPEVIQARKDQTRFSSGKTAYNKGMKQSEYMTAEAIEKTKATRFKKGDKPVNKEPIGTITIRTQEGEKKSWIKIAEGEWKQYHHYVYEQHHPKIVEEHLVIFIDGNSQNFDISNLKMVSKAENMFNNSKHNFHPEIIPTLVLLNKLKNRLNNISHGK